MLLIPASYVKPAPADHVGEMLACLGYHAPFLPPLVAGVLPLIELADCRWFIDPSRQEVNEVARTLFIICERKNSLDLVAEWANGNRAPLEKAAGDFLRKNEARIADHMAEIIRYEIAAPVGGFSLLPRSGGGSSGEWWFGGEWLGNIIQAACRCGLGSADEVLWEIPLAVVGHAYAAYLKAEGVKGVGRKEDEAEVERMIEEAEEREKAGRLHPWQIAEPEKYSPSDEQIRANPGIMKEYEDLLKNVHQC